MKSAPTAFSSVLGHNCAQTHSFTKRKTAKAAPFNKKRLSAPRVLDVGCGCGLIALMLAQRFPDSRLVALEIEPEAAAQAAENVNQSPFATQIAVRCGDFLNHQDEEALHEGELFDAIVSNPPLL